MSTEKTIKLIREVPEIPGYEFVGWDKIEPGDFYLMNDNTVACRVCSPTEFPDFYSWKFKPAITPVRHIIQRYPISVFDPNVHKNILVYGSGKIVICLRKINDDTYASMSSACYYAIEKLSRDFTHFTPLKLEETI